MREACREADYNLDEDVKRNIDQLQKDYTKKLDACQKRAEAEKKRGDELYLKYGDLDRNSIDFLYYGDDDHPLSGDDKLVYKMYDMGQRNKQALTNRALWNKNSLLPYFEEELRNHADSIWYDDETLENEF